MGMVMDWKILKSFMEEVKEAKLTDGRGGELYHDLLGVYLLISMKKNPVWEASDFDRLPHKQKIWNHLQEVMRLNPDDMPKVAADPSRPPVVLLFASHVLTRC